MRSCSTPTTAPPPRPSSSRCGGAADGLLRWTEAALNQGEEHTTARRSFTLRYTVRNAGILPSGPVTLPALLPPAVTPAGPSPRIASVPPRASRTAELRLRASRSGRFRIQTLARSRVGQALADVRVRVGLAQAAAAPPSPVAESSSPAGGSGSGAGGDTGGRWAVTAGLGGAAAFAAAAAWTIRRRRVG